MSALAVYTPPAITGYRQITQDELDLMNAIKDLGKKVGDFLDGLTKVAGIDQRWIAIGATDLQKGFMGISRAVAQPTTF
jgi:hypothetical protein